MENKDYYIALDLGSSNVIIMVGQKTEQGQLSIVDYAKVDIASQGVNRGEIKNIDLVEKSIKEAMLQIRKRIGVNILEAYTGISGHHIKCAKHSYFVYVGKDGEISQSDVQALSENMKNVQAPDPEKILMIFPQDYVVDDQERVINPVGMFGKKLKGNFNFIIGNKLAVERLEKALTKVNIKQKDMYLNPLVAAEAVVTQEEKEMGVAVLDLGAGTTDMTIYVDNSVAHLSVIPMGADVINKDIREYGIMERYIEDLKTKYGAAIVSEDLEEQTVRTSGGRASMEISYKNLSAIIQARLKDILDYVLAEIKHYGYENKLAAGLVISGGGAKLKLIAPFIKEYTDYDVRIATAENKVSENSMDMADNTILSTAIGILLKAIEDGAEPCKCEVVEPQVVKPEPVVEEKEVKVPVVEKVEEPEPQPEVKVETKPKKQVKNVFKKMWGKFTDAMEFVDDTDDSTQE